MSNIKIRKSDLEAPDFFAKAFAVDGRINNYEIIASPYVTEKGTIELSFELVIEIMEDFDTKLAVLDLNSMSEEDCIKGIDDYLSSVQLPNRHWFRLILETCSMLAKNIIKQREQTKLEF